MFMRAVVIMSLDKSHLCLNLESKNPSKANHLGTLFRFTWIYSKMKVQRSLWLLIISPKTADFGSSRGVNGPQRPQSVAPALSLLPVWPQGADTNFDTGSSIFVMEQGDYLQFTAAWAFCPAPAAWVHILLSNQSEADLLIGPVLH